jgi:hypothetical protein
MSHMIAIIIGFEMFIITCPEANESSKYELAITGSSIRGRKFINSNMTRN